MFLLEIMANLSNTSWSNETTTTTTTALYTANETDLDRCLTPQFMDAGTFFHCYGLLADIGIIRTVLELIIVGFGSFVANTIVIIMILMKPMALSTFDQIMIGHAIVDGLTGLIDIPIFHVNNFFGYWPLPAFFCYFWSSYDNNINTTTSLHMLFMTWVRLRSIQAPKTYQKEFLMRHPIRVMLLIWAFGLGIWTPLVVGFGIPEYACEPSISPSYLNTILNFTIWFVPLVAILVLSVWIVVLLHKRQSMRRKKSRSAGRTLVEPTMNDTVITNTFTSSILILKRNLAVQLKNFRLGTQMKFLIIVVSYWVQWFPPCFLVILNPLCNGCVPEDLFNAIYWLTYTVCLTDPLVVMFVNTNVPCFSKKSAIA